MVLVESVYSVLGDAAPLAELAAACAAYDAMLVVDEAHGLGVAGAGGRGLVRDLGLAGRDDVVVTATLSKSLGAQGGAVARQRRGRRAPRQPRPAVHLRHRPRARRGGCARWPRSRLLAAEPERPAVGAGAGPRPRRRTRASTAPAGAVLSVPMASPQVALAAQAAAREEGVLVGCFRPPSVPDGISRLRITTNAGLADADWARATVGARARSSRSTTRRRTPDEPHRRRDRHRHRRRQDGRDRRAGRPRRGRRVGRRREAGADRRRAGVARGRRRRGRPRAHRLRRPGVHRPRRPARSRHRGPAARRSRSRRSRSTPTGSGCSRSSTTR